MANEPHQEDIREDVLFLFVAGIYELPRALCTPAMTPLTRSVGYGGTHGSRPATVHFCRAGPVCPAGAEGRATARVAPTQKFILGRHTQKFLLTPGGKSDTLNAIQAMMGVAARSCGRKCPPDGTVMAVECGVFRIQVEPRTMILVRPELRRQFRAFFY